MSKISRHCPNCKRIMPYDWNKPQCKFCGSRVKLDVLGGIPMWDGEADLSGWGKKKFKPAKKITGRENEELKVVSVPETPQTNLSSFPPFVLLLSALLTLGVSSTVWIFRRLVLINECVRDEERVRIGGFYVWIFSHIAALGTFGWAVWAYVTTFDGDAVGYLRSSWQIPLALLYFAIVCFMSRYYLFWIRDAIAEEAMKSAAETDALSDDSYLFARAPLLLWYFGVAYLQLHVDRALRRGLLTAESFRIEEPEEESDEGDEGKKTPDDVSP